MRARFVSEAAVRAALKPRYCDIRDLTRIPHGQEKQAFRFADGACEYVVRVGRSAAVFEKDAFAFGRFRSDGLPIPEVFSIGDIDEYAYCVSERLPGTTLQDLAPGATAGVLEPAAGVLAAIAAGDVDGISGFGSFDATGSGAFCSWRDFLTSVSDPARFDWSVLETAAQRTIVSELVERCTSLAALCPESRALVHGDFGSTNVLTDGSRITGVVDWADAMIGDPLYDIANLFFWRTWLDCMEQQARYHETAVRAGGACERVLCYQLRIGLAEIHQSATAGTHEMVEWAVARCRALIA